MTRDKFITEIIMHGLKREEPDSDIYWIRKNGKYTITCCAFTGKVCALDDGRGERRFRLPYELVTVEMINEVAGGSK